MLYEEVITIIEQIKSDIQMGDFFSKMRKTPYSATDNK